MAAYRKRSIMPSPTGPQRQSRYTTIPSELILVKPIYRVASSRRDSKAGPGRKRKAGCKVIGRAWDFQRYYGKWWFC
jgi:hypothetical protein